VGLRAAAALGAPGLSRFIRRLALARTAPVPGTFDAFSDKVVGKQKGTPAVETSLAHIAAAYTYRPKPYDGPLALIWGVDQRAPADPTIGWGSLARTVRVMRMQGGHLSLLRDSIGEVARGMSAILAG
jgi:hypothetical protein